MEKGIGGEGFASYYNVGVNSVGLSLPLSRPLSDGLSLGHSSLS